MHRAGDVSGGAYPAVDELAEPEARTGTVPRVVRAPIIARFSVVPVTRA